MHLMLKRAYEPVGEGDGTRILVDRLWPRGLSKEKARIDLWLKNIAPSPELRLWFGHDPQRWLEFQSRYRRELRQKNEELSLLRQLASKRPITLIYAARDEQHNEAVVLHNILTTTGTTPQK
jgi:uncharacterized protein YeaO (DUF488 family)